LKCASGHQNWYRFSFTFILLYYVHFKYPQIGEERGCVPTIDASPLIRGGKGGLRVSDVPLLHMTQHTALLKIAMRGGEDPGIQIRGALLFAAGSMRPH
jgi:hypothetical protein